MYDYELIYPLSADYSQQISNIAVLNTVRIVYFYHSDHLGSSSLITDANGDIVQHIEYVPYGGTFIDERRSASSWHTPFLFSGKERDEETGLLYVSQRYQDEKYCIWYGVDQLALNYPNISSYVYCFGNPVKYTDPDGRGPQEMHAFMINWKAGMTDAGMSQSTQTEIIQTAGKNALRYTTPVEDIYGAFAGKDFDGAAYNRAAATAWSLLFIVPELKGTKWGKGILKLSEGAFHSASGLIFKLGSRDGNRLSHIFDHCTDNLSKKFHGVWTINKEQIVSKLDDAWKYIKENNIKPQIDPKSGNWNFIVNANEVVGKEGGKLGSGQKLDHILISVEPKTSNVVTAFPVAKPK